MDRPASLNGRCALAVVLFVAGLLGCGVQSGPTDSSLAFVQWASSARVPVSKENVRQLVGDAEIVAFGESAHGLEEGLISRNQLIQALAASTEFGGIAMETGYAESRAIDAFIQGGPGEARDVALEFLTSGFGNFRANVELIEWMRAANQRRNGNDRLRFFGIDLSLGGPTGSSATLAPIECALSRLDRVAPAAADALRRQLGSGLQRVLGQQQPMGERELRAYDELANSLLTEARRSGDPEAEHCAIVATQAGTVQRRAPPANPGAGIPRDAWRTLEARDMAMADNALWAKDQLGPKRKLLVFAHNAHIVNAPQRRTHLRNLAQPPRSMGQRLREQLGDALLIVAEAGAPESPAEPSNEFGDLARGGAKEPSLLDLRSAPPAVRSWLSRDVSFRADRREEMRLTPITAFDVAVVQVTQSAARMTNR